jgi:hypothetical protein
MSCAARAPVQPSYLQSVVKDVGLLAPFDRMILLVEIALRSLDRVDDRRTTGTINPGVVWPAAMSNLASKRSC